MKNNLKLLIFICVISLLFILSNCFIFLLPKKGSIIIFKNEVDIESIKLISIKDQEVEVLITPSKEEKLCAIDEELFTELASNTCQVTVSLKGDSVISFQDDRGIISNSIAINNYILEVLFDDIYYFPIGKEMDLKPYITYIGSEELIYEYDPNILNITDGILRTLDSGMTILEIKYQEAVIKKIQIIVSRDILLPDIRKKKQLSCKVYTEEQANMLDEILASRIKKAGINTRAGVVAAARFLTLEFPYRIPYFYENGRLHESSSHHADGEGRYYHVGLYLHKNKFSSITKKVAGPSIWGCGLTNYEPNPPNYIPLEKMPNGLDCSGFVSWAILNGGFDIGDLGAGPTNYNYELPDTGEFVKLTKDTIASNIIKPGDLLSMQGHIAIIIGIDENNIYVAESLPRFRGVVANVYNKNKISKTFSHVVLMDRVYKSDGNLTFMW